jgi:hypothetical protein
MTKSRINKTNKKYARNKKSRKSRKSRKTINIRNIRKNKRIIGGEIDKIAHGTWITSDKIVDPEEMCPICIHTFGSTPNCAIFIAPCTHKFHNNCLLRYCAEEIKRKVYTPTCPVCRQSLGFGNIDVNKFKNKALETPIINNWIENGKNELLDVYNNGQENCNVENI